MSEDNFQLKQLAVKLDDHIQNFDDYREKEEQRRNEENENWKKIIEVQKQNTETIGQLTAATAGVIEVYAAGQGVIKTGAAFGRFVKWLSGFAILSGAITWVYSLFNHVPPGPH